jgi:hypothetical protein
MGGGGGDGGYSARQAQQEAEKQKARDALNLMFGVAPSGGAAPTKEQFTKTNALGGVNTPSGWGEGIETRPTAAPVFDKAGYDAAMAKWTGRSAEAERNKTARDALYSGIRDNAFTAGKRGFDEMRDKAARDLKFSLFAQGLNGGSVDVDEKSLLGRTYDKGLLDLGAKADAAKTEFANADEQTRLGLLQSIDAGMDQGSALSSALNQMKINSDRSAAAAQGTALDDLFANAGLLYTKTNAARGRQAADDWFSTQYPQYRSPTSRTSSGIITPTS